MFNLRQSKAQKTSVPPQEKLLRENTLDKATESPAIVEKELDRKPDDYVTIEAQLQDARTVSGTTVIVEKALDDAISNYVPHRSAQDGLLVPPMNTLVEKMRQERLAEYKTEKESNWTVSFDDKKQQGDLPKWPKGPAQHDQIVLNNDPRRFESKEVVPLAGSITVAQIDHVVHSVKTGSSYDYDSAIVSILKTADTEKRELTKVEQKTISDIKKERTQALLES